MGPTPYKWFLPELDLHLSREWAALAPFSRISGLGHSGSWPLLHCGDSKHLALEVVPGASLHSEALSPECGREHQETGDCGPTRHVGAGLRGLLGLTAHGLLGWRHPGPRLSHMVGWGWGLKYRDSQIFVRGGLACAELPRGVEFGAL